MGPHRQAQEQGQAPTDSAVVQNHRGSVQPVLRLLPLSRVRKRVLKLRVLVHQN